MRQRQSPSPSRQALRCWLRSLKVSRGVPFCKLPMRCVKSICVPAVALTSPNLLVRGGRASVRLNQSVLGWYSAKPLFGVAWISSSCVLRLSCRPVFNLSAICSSVCEPRMYQTGICLVRNSFKKFSLNPFPGSCQTTKSMLLHLRSLSCSACLTNTS